MSGHTPGPWFLWRDDTDFTAIATVEQGKAKFDYDHEVLGTSEWMRWKDEDARLIAAAPDLLEALKQMRAVAWGNERQRADAIIQAEAAIAKAEGKS